MVQVTDEVVDGGHFRAGDGGLGGRKILGGEFFIVCNNTVAQNLLQKFKISLEIIMNINRNQNSSNPLKHIIHTDDTDKLKKECSYTRTVNHGIQFYKQ